jgi:putative aldouronate transport system permease protein
MRIIPKNITFEAIASVFRNELVLSGYANTLFITVVGTVLDLFLVIVAAYPLSKGNLRGKRVFMGALVFTMLFNGGLIPNFLLIRTLHLNNNFLVYIFPVLISAWNMTIMRNFFSSISETLFESARIDGANDLVIFFRIVLPLSTASLATIGLFYAVSQWNAWFDSMMYCTDRSLWTMQLFLREIIRNVQSMDLLDQTAILPIQKPPAESVQMATIVVATVPILCLYPFLQKYFVKGVMVGSLKG